MFEWTTEAVEQLRTLAAENLTARQIGLRMGITRNAVIGKCKRAKIQMHFTHASPVPREGQPPRKPRVGKFKGLAKITDAEWDAIMAWNTPLNLPLDIPLLELENHHCRSVSGHDGYLATYCGHDKREGSSYCGTHSRAFEYVGSRKVNAAAYIRPARAAA